MAINLILMVYEVFQKVRAFYRNTDETRDVLFLQSLKNKKKKNRMNLEINKKSRKVSILENNSLLNAWSKQEFRGGKI